tara:strand:- start:113 stop:529 length:417 start_codon:yes stop_codon:yes gene_type:complete
MTSQLNVDTIVDKAGSGGTNVKVGNNAVAVAEGGSATTNVVQGLAKAWCEGNGSAVSQDSLNIASGTDNGTGDYTYTLTSAMVSQNYSITVSCHATALSATNNDSQQTNSYKVNCFLKSNLSNGDDRNNYSVIMGDLA